MTRVRGIVGAGIIGWMLIMGGPALLSAEEPVSGDSGPSRRLPSGRGRATPQRPAPATTDQTPSEKPPAGSKSMSDEALPSPSVGGSSVDSSAAPLPDKPVLSTPPPSRLAEEPAKVAPVPAMPPARVPSEKAIAQPKMPPVPVEAPSAAPKVGSEPKGQELSPSAAGAGSMSVGEAPSPAPALQPAESPTQRRLPSRISPARKDPDTGPPVPTPPPMQADGPAKPAIEPKTLVQPQEQPTPVPPVGLEQKPVDAPVAGPMKPAGGDAPASTVPFALPAEGGSDKRLPSGRMRPSGAQSPPAPVVADGSDPTQAQIDEYQRSNFLPIRDRWRILSSGGLLDPYAQNVLKGDFPVIGQNIFLNVTAVSDSLFEARTLPTAQGVSRERAGSGDFFGQGRQLFFNQNFVTSFELFQGSTGFKPRDWAVRLTPVFNVNYLNAQEKNVVKLDVRDGTSRTDNQIAFQEAFVEKRLVDVSKNFDFVSLRAGIQGFTSDFRGFIFSDNEPGLRFFGNFDNNRYQWNIAYFNLLEKDTNSMLNSFELRHRQVVVANLYRQDFIWQGYTTQISFHHDRDDSGTQDPNGQQYDRNGFLVRPAKIGDVRSHNIRSYYLGWAGDGHIGRFNISHAIYQVLGDVTHDTIAGRAVSINAQMAAVELSYDIDWLRPKVSVFYGSGDRNPTDGTARGFDSILDNVNFAGSGFSFWNRQGVGLTQTGINLNNRFSLLNDFRSSKTQGQAQFVNPGVIVANAGLDAELTPKLKAVLNFNYLWFAATEPLKYVLHQPQVRNTIGADYSIGLIYRPLLSQNIVLSGGIAYFTPGAGFKDIQVNENLYSAFFSATLTF